MRRRGRVTLVAVIGLVAAVGQASPASSGNAPNSATGSGHITVNGEVRTFAFSATEHRDGTVSGQAQVISRSLDTIVHFEIDCLRLVGNVAHMSGITSRSNNPTEAPEGQLRRFVVQDNGERAGSPPDLISTIPANPSGETCENSTLVPNRPVEDGNVQVR